MNRAVGDDMRQLCKSPLHQFQKWLPEPLKSSPEQVVLWALSSLDCTGTPVSTT